DAFLSGVGLSGHRLSVVQRSGNTWGGCRRKSANPSTRSALPAGRVTSEATAEPEQRGRAGPQRSGPDRGTAVEHRGGLAQRLAQRFVVRMPPGVAQGRALPHAQLDVHAFIEPELGVGAAQAGVLDTAPRALTGAVAEHVVVDPHHPGLQLAGDPLALAAIGCPNRRAETEHA